MSAVTAKRSTKRASAKPPDFFVSYTASDLHTAKIFRDWLEEEGFSTVMQARDFHTGGHIPSMIEDGLNAKKILAVMSDGYLRSEYCRAELGAAVHRDPTNAEGRMIIVRISQCEVPALLAPISRIELVGKVGENTRDEFLESIRKIKARRRSPKSKGSNPPPPINLGATPMAHVGRDGVAVVGNNNKVYMGPEGRSPGRAKPPDDVISEEQAVKLRNLLHEVVELDSGSYGGKLTAAKLQQKWWGALDKGVPKTTYTNYSQAKYRKAFKWLQGHRARLIAGAAEEEPELSRHAAIRTIHILLSRGGIKGDLAKRQYYESLSNRLANLPIFTSSTELSHRDLQRVVGAMRRDFT